MKSMDIDLLNELIKKCEAKMASPFKKVKEEEPEAAIISVEEEPKEEISVEDSSDSEISPEDLKLLLEKFKGMK